MKRSDSTRPILRGVLLMLISSFSTCVGQLFWKLSATGSVLFLLAGFALYGVGALLMLLAMNYGDLSVLHPMLGAGYVLSLLLGSVLLNEPLSSTKLIGVAVIVAGLVLLARSGEGGR